LLASGDADFGPKKRAELQRGLRVISPRVDLCPDLFSPVAKSYGKDGQDPVACCSD